jgi:hypothetical protein
LLAPSRFLNWRWIKRLEVVAMVSKGDNAASPPTPSDTLVEALRELVREELKRPPPPTIHERPPTWRDGFWLLVFIVDVVLLVALIPETWWNDPALEIVGKILPALGGGTLILGATWFRERLLAFSRSRVFMVTMASALLPLVLLQVRFVPLRPRVDPQQATIYVDGDKPKEDVHSFDGQHAIRLRLRNHTFKIQRQLGGGKVEERAPFEWSWRRLLWAWLRDNQPQWGLIYPLRITTDGEPCTVHISMSNPQEQLDTDFEYPELEKSGNSLQFTPKFNTVEIDLPMGKYDVSLEKKGFCPVTVRCWDVPSNEAVDFASMKKKKKEGGCPTLEHPETNACQKN